MKKHSTFLQNSLLCKTHIYRTSRILTQENCTAFHKYLMFYKLYVHSEEQDFILPCQFMLVLQPKLFGEVRKSCIDTLPRGYR